MSKEIRVCLVQYIFHEAFKTPSSNLKRVLSSLSELYVINVLSDNLQNLEFKNDNINEFNIVHKKSKNNIIRILRYIKLQFMISLNLIKLSKNFDCIFLFLESGELFPVIIAKLLGKKVYWELPSHFKEMLYYNDDKITHILIYLQKVSYSLVDHIILHSPNLIDEWGLERYVDKILFAHEYFVDFNIFRTEIEFKNRENIIGFVGRLSKEKGILNFVKSIPLILRDFPKLQFCIIGDGNLKPKIVEYLNEKNLGENVKLVPWVKREDLPSYFNKLKLLVIPSYTESGPIVAIESMACGTPILLNKVGHISNILKNEKYEYILEDNSPNCIAEGVKKFLMDPNMNRIACNSQKIVQRKFNLKETIMEWQKILRGI